MMQQVDTASSFGRHATCARFGRALLFGACLLFGLMEPAFSQSVTFSNHREVQIPKYATVRIGPFYSTALFTQSAGYTYTRTRGTGTDYLFNNRRGTVNKDGSEFPIITTLTFRNYLLITRRMVVDMSIRLGAEYYPLETRENRFYVDLADEGLFANLSTQIILTPFVKILIYDRFVYKTDWVDTRGIEDTYGGSEYEYIRNTLGADLNWLVSRDGSLALGVMRTDNWPQGDEFAEQESVSYVERASYQHRLVSGVSAGARASFTQTDYSDETRNDIRIQDYSLFAVYDRSDREGIRLRLTDVTVVMVGIGYSFGYAADRESHVDDGVVVDGGGAQDVESFTWFASISTRLRQDLMHRLSYSRVLRGAFDTPFQIADIIEYRINWKGDVSAVGFYTRYSEVDPNVDGYPTYTDWTTGADLVYPLTRYIDLIAMSQYSVRGNGDADSELALDNELLNDYETWVTRAGTSFRVTKSINFRTYVQHTERTSGDDDLTYTRDSFGAIFTYSTSSSAMTEMHS